MSLLVWNQSLVTGIPVLDGQHQRFVELLNRVAPAANVRAVDTATLAPLRDELVDYTRMHFAEEESLMSRVGLDARFLAHHHRQHDRLAQRLDTMRTDVLAARMEASDIVAFLSGWLVFHILGEDRAMARQLRARAGGASPEEAYVIGRGDDTDPSPDTLNHTLVEAFTRLNRQNCNLDAANQQLVDQRALPGRHEQHVATLLHERTTALAALAQDLSRARDLAEAGSRAKSRFLAIVGHELRAPVNAVCGYSQRLRESGVDEEQAALARELERTADRMSRLVERIVDYVGDDASGAVHDERVTFAPHELLVETCAPFRSAARQKGVAFDLTIGEDVPSLARGPAAVLQRILTELVDNAVKFTSEGSVRVSGRADPTERRSVVRLILHVEDSGCGIEAAQAEQLFLAFARSDDTVDRCHEGRLGIGLALAKRMADRIGAALRLEPTRCRGRGSEFRLELDLEVGEDVPTMPRVRAADGVTPTPAPARPPALSSAAPEADVDEWMHALFALLVRGDKCASEVARHAPPAAASLLGMRLPEIVRRTEIFDYEGAIAVLRPVTPPLSACTEETA